MSVERARDGYVDSSGVSIWTTLKSVGGKVFRAFEQLLLKRSVGHVTRHDSLSKTIFQGTLDDGRLWSAEEMLDGQHQRMSIPAHARVAHSGLYQNRLEEGLYWIVCHTTPTPTPDDPIGQGTELCWTEATQNPTQGEDFKLWPSVF